MKNHIYEFLWGGQLGYSKLVYSAAYEITSRVSDLISAWSKRQKVQSFSSFEIFSSEASFNFAKFAMIKGTLILGILLLRQHRAKGCLEVQGLKSTITLDFYHSNPGLHPWQREKKDSQPHPSTIATNEKI